MKINQQQANMIAHLVGLIDGDANDPLGVTLQEVVDYLEHQPTLKVVQCNEHDHTVVYLDDEIVCESEYSVENLYRLMDHLNWSTEVEIIDAQEFERRYA